MIQQLDNHHDYFTEGSWTMAAERDNWGQGCLLCWFLPNHSCALTVANLAVSVLVCKAKPCVHDLQRWTAGCFQWETHYLGNHLLNKWF